MDAHDKVASASSKKLERKRVLQPYGLFSSATSREQLSQTSTRPVSYRCVTLERRKEKCDCRGRIAGCSLSGGRACDLVEGFQEISDACRVLEAVAGRKVRN